MIDETNVTKNLPTTEELTQTAQQLTDQMTTLYAKGLEELRENPWRYAAIAGGLAATIAAVWGGLLYKRK